MRACEPRTVSTVRVLLDLSTMRGVLLVSFGFALVACGARSESNRLTHSTVAGASGAGLGGGGAGLGGTAGTGATANAGVGGMATAGDSGSAGEGGGDATIEPQPVPASVIGKEYVVAGDSDQFHLRVTGPDEVIVTEPFVGSTAIAIEYRPGATLRSKTREEYRVPEVEGPFTIGVPDPFRVQSGYGNHWAALALAGDDTGLARDALGWFMRDCGMGQPTSDRVAEVSVEADEAGTEVRLASYGLVGAMLPWEALILRASKPMRSRAWEAAVAELDGVPVNVTWQETLPEFFAVGTLARWDASSLGKPLQISGVAEGTNGVVEPFDLVATVADFGPVRDSEIDFRQALPLDLRAFAGAPTGLMEDYFRRPPFAHSMGPEPGLMPQYIPTGIASACPQGCVEVRGTLLLRLAGAGTRLRVVSPYVSPSTAGDQLGIEASRSGGPTVSQVISGDAGVYELEVPAGPEDLLVAISLPGVKQYPDGSAIVCDTPTMLMGSFYLDRIELVE